jgi:hypothetical protein
MKTFVGLGLVGTFVVASPANIKLGEQIGAVLSKGLSSDPAGFESEFEKSTANTPILSSDAIEKVASNHLAKSAFLAAKTVDYDRCPVGWELQGTRCHAPDGYFQCASKSFDLRLLNHAYKQKLADKCGLEFPTSFAQVGKYWPEFVESPILNVHVKESPNDASINSAVEQAQRQQLASLESEEATTKEILSDMIGRLNIQVEETQRKISNRQTSFLSIASDVQREKENLMNLRSEMNAIKQRLQAKGYSAYNGLVHLLNLVSEPNFRTVAFMTMIPQQLDTLLKTETTPDSIRMLAGSILTHIVNMPVASEVSDTQGGAGHVNIIVPRPSRVYSADSTVLALKAGADAADVA